jgi:hypothetical protein
MKSAFALSLTELMPTYRFLWQRWCRVGVVSDSADADLALSETALIYMRQRWVRSLNFKWFLSRLKRNLLVKKFLDMYSPNTMKKKKIWLSAVSDNADENSFLNIFAKS